MEARAPLEAQLGEFSSLIAEKQREQRDAIGKDKINQINFDIQELRNYQGDILHKLNEIGEVGNFEIEDHQRWERFSYTEGLLLRAFHNEELTVGGSHALNLSSHLWKKLPDDFGWDWELSLVFLPCPYQISHPEVRA